MSKTSEAKRKKLPPGFIWRGNTIHIDTTVGGQTVRKSTRTNQLKEAVTILDEMKFQSRHRNLTGQPQELRKTWAEAIMRYFDETTHKHIGEEKRKLNYLRKFIPLEMQIKDIYNSTLEPMREELNAKFRKANTHNAYRKVVRQILNKAAAWEENGEPWLRRVPKIIMESITKNPRDWMNKKDGYSLGWEEQDRLLVNLPPHLKDAALYSVNTGAREGEISNLRWSWERFSADLGINVFIIPSAFHKNGKPKLVVLNSIAKQIIERKRGVHPEFVFTYQGEPIKKLNASSWRKNRDRTKLSHVTFHDLRHTFATRLAGYGVSEPEIASLLGHTVPGVTATYAFTTQSVEPMLANAEKLVDRKPMTFIRLNDLEEVHKHTKTPQNFYLCGESND